MLQPFWRIKLTQRLFLWTSRRQVTQLRRHSPRRHADDSVRRSGLGAASWVCSDLCHGQSSPPAPARTATGAAGLHLLQTSEGGLTVILTGLARLRPVPVPSLFIVLHQAGHYTGLLLYAEGKCLGACALTDWQNRAAARALAATPWVGGGYNGPNAVLAGASGARLLRARPRAAAIRARSRIQARRRTQRKGALGGRPRCSWGAAEPRLRAEGERAYVRPRGCSATLKGLSTELNTAEVWAQN